MEQAIHSKTKWDGILTARVKRQGSSRWIKVFSVPVKNLLVDTGIAQAALLQGSTPAEVWTLGRIGTGTTPAATGDTALETQVDSQTAAFSRVTTAITNDTPQWVSTHTAPGGGWNITEYGLFNASAVMYNHVIFSAIALAENDQLEMTYKSQVSAA